MKNDDLLNTNPKKDLKKPLIFGAIGFLIFVIIVIIIAIFQNTTSNSTNEILPPVENNSINNVNNSTFKPLKIETNTTENQSNKNKNNKIYEKNITNSKEKNSIDKQVLLKESEKNSTSVNHNKLNIKKNSASQTLPTKSTNTKKVSTPKPKKTEKIIQKTIKNGKYYIQVAALLKNSKPNKKFLKLITKSGFKYKYYHTYIKRNGEKIKVTKILIGPFKTKKDAKKALYKIKREITQTAFIFKVK